MCVGENGCVICTRGLTCKGLVDRSPCCVFSLIAMSNQFNMLITCMPLMVFHQKALTTRLLQNFQYKKREAGLKMSHLSEILTLSKSYSCLKTFLGQRSDFLPVNIMFQ